MPRHPDAALEVALEQRQRHLDTERQALAEREAVVAHEATVLQNAEARVRMVLLQMDSAQKPVAGLQLPVALLGQLERLLRWCEEQVVAQRAVLEAAQTEADTARGAVAAAHQQVRALELVLDARAADRAEKQRRAELRQADETAARVHARNSAGR